MNDPYGSATVLASERKRQYVLDTQKQITQYKKLSANTAAYNSKEYKDQLAISRSRMKEIADTLQDRYEARRKQSEQTFAKLDEDERREKSITNILAKSARSAMNAVGLSTRTKGKSGGSQSKEILGKQRRIYKVAGSRKEHIKYKGELIPVSDYKKLFKK
jgi:hypothetical protein